MALLNSNSTVVVPWDFSGHSREALGRALNLVDDPSQIRVINVAQLPVMVGPGMFPSSSSQDSLKESSLAKFRESVSDDPRCNDISYTALVMDEQAHAICDFAQVNNAELIVISTHGRTGFRRLTIGSVAERVVRYAACPVLVVRSHD